MEKTNDKRRVPSSANLIRKAEKLLKTRDPDSVFANGEDEVVRLIHELQVNQVELELQNEMLRQTQEELNIAKEHYSDLYNLAPVGYCTVSEKGLVLEANLTSTIKLGVTRESMLHKPLSHYIFTEDQNIYYFFFRKLTSNTKEPQACELRMVKSDNTPFWVSLRAKEAYVSEGNPSYLLTIIDITKLKQAEEELSFNLSLFQSTVEATADGILVVGRNGKISAYNRLFAKMWQIPDDILAGKDDKGVLNFIIDQLTNPVEFLQLVNDLYDQPDAVRFDTIEFKDGRIFERYTRPQVVGNVIIGRAWSFRDVTEHHQIVAKLSESERRFRDMLSNIEQVAVMLDVEGNITFCSDFLLNLTGWQKIEVIGKNWFKHFIAPKKRKQLEAVFSEAIRTGNAPLHYENEIITRQGEPLLIMWGNTVLRDEQGRFTGTASLGCDITERRLAEKLLHSINVNLKQRVEQQSSKLQETQKQFLHAEKLSTIGKLSASIAHEFNNPLQGIQNTLKGLRKRAILEEEDKELLDSAISESDRMKDLIRSIQDFNRPTSGKKTIINLHKIIDSLLLLHKSDFRRKRISLVRNYTEDLPQIIGIPDQIKQVFLNLINNATDACHGSRDEIRVTTWRENDMVAVAIEDSGIGIDPKDADKIFQPFYTTKSVKGTGLGLSVSLDIIKQHQGEIRVESKPGEGTIFTVLLPV